MEASGEHLMPVGITEDYDRRGLLNTRSQVSCDDHSHRCEAVVISLVNIFLTLDHAWVLQC